MREIIDGLTLLFAVASWPVMLLVGWTLRGYHEREMNRREKEASHD